MNLQQIKTLGLKIKGLKKKQIQCNCLIKIKRISTEMKTTIYDQFQLEDKIKTN